MDAFPITVTEAFCAGVPIFISDQVGTRSMYNVLPKGKEFIIDLNQLEEGTEKILSFLSLGETEKVKLSDEFKKVSKNYTELKAIQNYSKLIEEFSSKT